MDAVRSRSIHRDFEPLSDKFLAGREWLRALAVFGAIAVDAAVVIAAAVTAAYLRFRGFPAGNTTSLIVLILPAYLLAALTFQAYDLDTLKQGGRSVLRANLALLTAAGFAFSAAFALQVGSRFSRLETGYMLVAASLYLTIGRIVGAAWLERVRNAIEPNVFVLGDESAFAHGGRVDKTINVRRFGWTPTETDPDFLDTVYRTFRHADRVLLIFADPEERRDWAAFMRQTGVNAEVVEPMLARVVPIGIGRWADIPTLIVSRGPLSLPERVGKRLFDLTLTLAAAPIVVPLVGLLAILIKLESPGPCLFVQERVGRQNGRYRCYKLRTMHVDGTDAAGHVSVSRDDRRVTPLGRVLRRTSLDELPQLWNVFLGEMSLVGPRPHALGSTAEGALFWEAVKGYWTRHAVKPGITGLAQIRGFRGATESRGDLRLRVAADLEYINTWSIWLDVKILVRTLWVVVHRNAF